MLKSFWLMYAHPPGFAPERILSMQVDLAGPHYGDKASHEGYVRELLRRVESAPGVQAAGVSVWFLFEGASFPSDTSPQQHTIRLNAVSPGYLKALGVNLQRGRWLADADAGGKTVLLNESMARQAFGGADPLGRQISTPAPATVVGVVSDLKYSQLDAEPPAEIYIPYQQLPFLAGTSIAVRTVGEASAMAPVVHKLVSEIDPTQPVYGVKTLEQSPCRFHCAAALQLLPAGDVRGRRFAARTGGRLWRRGVFP